MLTSPLTHNHRDFCRSRVGSLPGTGWSAENSNAREFVLAPELAIGARHVMRRPFVSVMVAHVVALAVVLVGGKPRRGSGRCAQGTLG